MKVDIIANPVAGGGRGRGMAEALYRAVKSGGDAVDLTFTGQAGDGRAAAARSEADLVAVVGGDGSINEVLNGLAIPGAALAVLPVGTANVVARELGVPGDPDAVATLITERRLRPMDVGLCGDRRFLLGAGAGLDAAVAAEVSRHRGRRSSLMKWVGPSLKTCFSYSFPKIRVSVDGEVVSDSAQYAVVGNCRYSAGVFQTTPRALIDDGLLDVCLFHNLHLLRLAPLALALRRPNFVARKDVVYRQGRDVEFAPVDDEQAPLQIDGDPAGAIPAVFSVLPRAIQVIAANP